MVSPCSTGLNGCDQSRTAGAALHRSETNTRDGRDDNTRRSRSLPAMPRDSDDSPASRRPIRSFVLRAGRTTRGQSRALAELGPRLLLAYRPEPLDMAALFGREA